jgi:hypothetical protein
LGSRNNPGKWDCHANAHPDEPMFVLLGRDPSASLLVRLWAEVRAKQGEDPAMVQEARDCADAMEAWVRDLGKSKKLDETAEVWVKTLIHLNPRRAAASRTYADGMQRAIDVFSAACAALDDRSGHLAAVRDLVVRDLETAPAGHADPEPPEQETSIPEVISIPDRKGGSEGEP